MAPNPRPILASGSHHAECPRQESVTHRCACKQLYERDRELEQGVYDPGDGGPAHSPADAPAYLNGETVDWGDIETPPESAGPLHLLRPACERCFLELPKSGVCGNCG